MISPRIFLQNIVPALLCAGFISGCSGCGTEPPPEPLIRTPQSGSSFTYDNHEKDSTGEFIPGSHRVSTRTIVATGLTVQGMNGVVRYVEDADTFHLRYEANGDAAFLQPELTLPEENFRRILPDGIPTVKVPPRWIAFPFGSKTTMTVPSYDTMVTLTYNGLPIPVNGKMTGTTSYIGNEDLTVGADKIATNKALLNLDVTIIVPLLGTIKTSTIDTIWFAPKLGMFVKDNGMTRGELPAQFGGNRVFGGTYNVLTSYSLK